MILSLKTPTSRVQSLINALCMRFKKPFIKQAEQRKRSFSLLEVMLSLVIAGMVLVPLAQAPNMQLRHMQADIQNFERSLQNDLAMAEALGKVVSGQFEIDKLPENAQITIAPSPPFQGEPILVEFDLINKDTSSPPKVALVSLSLDTLETSSSSMYSSLILCLVRKR